MLMTSPDCCVRRNDNPLRWMQLTISCVEQVPDKQRLRVGALALNDDGELLCVVGGLAGSGSFSWRHLLTTQLRLHIGANIAKLYVTVNTLSSSGKSDLDELCKEFDVDEVCFGLPDPSLTSIAEDDPVLVCGSCCRYPDELQRAILDQNAAAYQSSKQNIGDAPLFSDVRISEILLSNLAASGIEVTRKELDANRSENALTNLVATKFAIDDKEAFAKVRRALSEAFGTKYGAYNPASDVRSRVQEWSVSFMRVYRSLMGEPLDTQRIIDVGVDGGYEAAELFSSCSKAVFVDISEHALASLRLRLPNARTICASADNLSQLEGGAFDLYISLRTFNSSFFNLRGAVSEAYRLLESGGGIIASVANGFLCADGRTVLSGLLVPGTTFVDIYRGISAAERLQNELRLAGFENVGLISSETEIYVVGTKA